MPLRLPNPDVPVQIPVSLLARRIGEKLMLTINLVANAAGCAVFPAVARAGGPGALSVLLAVMGAAQASRVASGNVLRNRWIPVRRSPSLLLACNSKNLSTSII